VAIYFFSQLEIEPNASSALFQTFPEVNGAFVNSLVRSESPESAIKTLMRTLEEDGYRCINAPIAIMMDTVALAKAPEFDHMLEELTQAESDVVYGEFRCYE
jgi:hypothetical protein